MITIILGLSVFLNSVGIVVTNVIFHKQMKKKKRSKKKNAVSV